MRKAARERRSIAKACARRPGRSAGAGVPAAILAAQHTRRPWARPARAPVTDAHVAARAAREYLRGSVRPRLGAPHDEARSPALPRPRPRRLPGAEGRRTAVAHGGALD